MLKTYDMSKSVEEEKNRENGQVNTLVKKPYEDEPEPYARFDKWDKWVKENCTVEPDLWDDVNIGLKTDLYHLFG